ncbi:MAG: N-acetylmuramoyl-L-alanine amidase [Bacteroidia bacterium]|nr:N-acetylmuramoyl-L-alanine amidase [Bacteroidia bacterium]
MRTINLIVIHCSATRSDQSLSVEALEACHRQRGFNGIGYHFFITQAGTVFETRPLEVVGAHVQGFNAHSIGICYEGGLDAQGGYADTRTPAQKRVLRQLVVRLLRCFPGCRVCGHRDLSPDRNANGVVEPQEWTKACPCFDVVRDF